MKKHDMEGTTIRKTPLHVPDTGPHIRQGLSNMFDAPTTPEGVACSRLSGTTLFCDSSLLSQSYPFRLHCGGWVVDCVPRQAYNVSVMAPGERW